MGGFERRGRAGRKMYRWALSAACLALANCAGNNVAGRVDSGAVAAKSAAAEADTAGDARQPDQAAARKQAAAEPTRPARKTGPADAPPRAAARSISYSAVGLASWYGAGFHGRRTADGEIFDMNSLTAAHPTLPLPCHVRVTNLANSRSIVVRVNDRGPFTARRVIDVSARTAKLLGFYDHGLARVKVDYVGRAALPAAPKRVARAGAPL